MRNILIIESNRKTLDYVARIIERLGYTAHRSDDGASGLLHLDRHPIEKVICGDNLPDYNVLDLCRSIRSEPGHIHTPIIVLTSDKSDEFYHQATASVGAIVVHKPVSIRPLFHALEGGNTDRKRQHIRSPMRFPVQVSVAGKEHQAETVNFGEGGMYICHAPPPPVNARLSLKFQVPGLSREFSFQARVRHCVQTASEALPAGMGVMFEDISETVQSLFALYMENHLAREAAVPH